MSDPTRASAPARTAIRFALLQTLHDVRYGVDAATDAVLEALNELPPDERMAAMGMEPVGLAHQTCGIDCVHYGALDDEENGVDGE